MNKTIIIVIAVVVIGAGAAWAGGVFKEKAAEEIIENAIESQDDGDADVDIDLSDEEANIEVNGSTLQVGNDVAIPEEFPDDVFLPDGTVAAVVNTAEGAYSVTMTSTASLMALRDDYETRQAGDGWTKSSSVTVGAGVIILWEKADRALSVTLTDNSDGTTTIGLSVGPAS